ncbi:ArsC family reductase [Acetobacter sp. TBRC 12305]|uniref:ArsC family reductase n=1 Tax=Acetobacter garciniae TaxID=2817435 RepID=A0A939HNK0_9PROT|nr:ArsC family reductase [Acetobacter garciniae]MBX0344684.1 ArsC family reductase [Acetobacter garciniae]
MAAVLYGIKSCDTMRKARQWLDSHGIAYTFHDYKTQGVPPAQLKDWVADVGWEKLLNRAGTTFRGLAEADRQGLDQTRAMALMLAHPSLIKRPVLVREGKVTLGFKPEIYAALFGVQ